MHSLTQLDSPRADLSAERQEETTPETQTDMGRTCETGNPGLEGGNTTHLNTVSSHHHPLPQNILDYVLNL